MPREKKDHITSSVTGKTSGFFAMPFQSKNRKRFTREEIKEQILALIMLDPQPSGKQLSKREKAENFMHAKIARYFDEPKHSDQF